MTLTRPMTSSARASTRVTVPSTLLPTNTTERAVAAAGAARPAHTAAARSHALRAGALRMMGQTIVGDSLPGAGVVDELVIARPHAGIRVEDAEANAERLFLVRVPAPEGRAAARAECLREPACRLVLAHQLGALDELDGAGLDTRLGRGRRPRSALAASAVAVAGGTERTIDLGPDGSAHAAAR